MKYLVVILVVVIAAWLMLRNRDGRREPSRRPPGARKGAEPAEMVQCLHCGIHLPRSDAIEDKRGAFCTEAHRLAGPP